MDEPRGGRPAVTGDPAPPLDDSDLTEGAVTRPLVRKPKVRVTRVRMAIAASAIVVVGAAMGIWSFMGGAEGPMYYPHAGHDTIGFNDVHAGDVLTFGAVNVLNSGDQQIVLKSAELVGADTSVAQATQVLTAGPDRSLGGVATGRGKFPPSAEFGVPLKDIKGSLVPPERTTGQLGTELLIRVDVRRSGEVTFTGVKVIYEYQGDTYTYVDPTGLRLCPGTCSS